MKGADIDKIRKNNSILRKGGVRHYGLTCQKIRVLFLPFLEKQNDSK
jgi:hypothetical protein